MKSVELAEELRELQVFGQGELAEQGLAVDDVTPITRRVLKGGSWRIRRPYQLSSTSTFLSVPWQVETVHFGPDYRHYRHPAIHSPTAQALLSRRRSSPFDYRRTFDNTGRVLVEGLK